MSRVFSFEVAGIYTRLYQTGFTIVLLCVFEINFFVIMNYGIAEMVEAPSEAVKQSEKHFAKLSSSPVFFDPVSANVNVFFDDANQQVFVVRSNGAGGIIMFDGATSKSTTFRIDDKGDIAAVRFSPSLHILAVQRAPNALDFINFIKDSKKESSPYCQMCKGKTTRITDFFWASDTEIIFITDTGIEFYEIDGEKKSLKCMKTLSIGLVNWSLWHKESKHLLISSGIYGNVLYPFQYENGTLSKYGKLEIDLAFYPADPKLTLLRKDVILSKMYNQVYIVVLKQDSRVTQSAQIVLYKLTKERLASKSNVLKFTCNGQFQVNVVDSMILVHHLHSKTTFLYDIKFASVNVQQVIYYACQLVLTSGGVVKMCCPDGKEGCFGRGNDIDKKAQRFVNKTKLSV